MVAGEATGKAIDYIEDAEPYALTTFENILASDPLILVGGAGALGLVYLLAPLLFSSVAYSSRGYKGTFSPPTFHHSYMCCLEVSVCAQWSSRLYKILNEL